jgi:hypothetical protein
MTGQRPDKKKSVANDTESKPLMLEEVSCWLSGAGWCSVVRNTCRLLFEGLDTGSRMTLLQGIERWRPGVEECTVNHRLLLAGTI